MRRPMKLGCDFPDAESLIFPTAFAQSQRRHHSCSWKPPHFQDWRHDGKRDPKMKMNQRHPIQYTRLPTRRTAIRLKRAKAELAVTIAKPLPQRKLSPNADGR